MEKLAWSFVSNGRAVCSFSTKQAFYSLKPPGKSYVSQVGVRLIIMAYFRLYNFPKLKNHVYIASFDIPAAITLHIYNVSVHDKT